MILTLKQCMEKYGSKYLMQKAIAQGRLFRLDRGVYSDKKNESEMAVVSKKYPHAVFTLNSAFYYYGLTDSIPEKCYLATRRGAKKITDSQIVQKFENSDILYLGTVQVEYNGTSITMYNRERLLLELLRNKNSLPFDYYKEILLNYRLAVQDLDLQLIQDYIQKYPKAAMIEQALQLEVL